MYKIIGADGKEYGPVNQDQLQQWVAQGRITPQTRIKQEGSTDWKTAAEIPELNAMLAGRPSTPGVAAVPTAGPASASGKRKGLAISSLTLGIPSLFLCSILTGIPAVICGHLALGRTKRSPSQYGGAGMAIAGLVMGYLSIVLLLVSVPLVLLPILAQLKERQCRSNLNVIATAFQNYALDNSGDPFTISTNSGGTLEVSLPDSNGLDKNSYLEFITLSNLLKTTAVLVCPSDGSKKAASSWQTLGPDNVTYRVHMGTNDAEPLIICPIHGTAALRDASVKEFSRFKQK